MNKVDFLEAFTVSSPALRRTSRLVVIFGIVLIGLIWFSIFYLVQRERQEEINDNMQVTAKFARAFEEHTLRTIRSADQTVLFLKYQYEKEGRTINIPKYISEGRLINQPFVLLGIIDEYGDLAVSSQVPFVHSNLKDREHFLVHKEFDTGKLFISKPVLGRSSGKWSIQMTRRINKPDGSFGGVAVVSLNPFYFSDFYRQIDLGKDSSISLVGRDGIVRARQADQSSSVGQNLSNSEFMKSIGTSDAGSYTATSVIDGVTRIYSYRALKDYPFVVVVGVSEAEVLRTLEERFVLYYIATGILTVVIALFMMALLQMITKQNRAEKALKQAHGELEDKVALRTAELSVTNRDLQDVNQILEEEVAERREAEEQLGKKNSELGNAYIELRNAQSQIIHQEKMASIGQLAAGVAHEINNPAGFIISNLESLQKYTTKIASFLTTQERMVTELAQNCEEGDREKAAVLFIRLKEVKRSLKIDYIIHDTDDLIKETLEGANRVKKIVLDLKGFARMTDENAMANINDGLESTINIIWNELKYKATLVKEFGDVPLINCNLS